MRKVTIFLIAISLLLFFSFLVSAQEEAKKTEKPKHEYIGVKKCKICHKKDGIYPSWLETKHANAWEILDSTAQKKEECVGCHSTGITAKGELLEGVQCEACHGPGSAYKKKSIMENHEKAMANGLLKPTKETCIACHENVPEEFRSKEKFDYEKMKDKGVHGKIIKVEAKEKEKKG